MDRAESDLTPGRQKASVWPLFVALGLVISEVGIFMDGLYPVAVAGLLLFVGSVAAIVSEADYVERPWRLLGGLGALLVVAGALVLYSQVGTDLLSAFASENSVIVRGYAVIGAGIVAMVGSLAGAFVVDTDRGALPE